jgi:archaeal type IV pilus assembly protein PilA
MLKSSENAVSPVVGVMLMLVVTIIIAAVVSGFAGGLVSGSEKAPQASLDVEIALSDSWNGDYMIPQMTIKHLGGDVINTKNVKLVTKWANETGEYHIASTVAPVWGDESVEYAPSVSSNYTLASLNTHYTGSGSDYYYNEPYLVVPGDMPTDDGCTSLWFGNFLFKAGDVMKVSSINTDVGNSDYQNQAKSVIKDASLLTGNELINVQLIDLNSGTEIYDRDIAPEV